MQISLWLLGNDAPSCAGCKRVPACPGQPRAASSAPPARGRRQQGYRGSQFSKGTLEGEGKRSLLETSPCTTPSPCFPPLPTPDRGLVHGGARSPSACSTGAKLPIRGVTLPRWTGTSNLLAETNAARDENGRPCSRGHSHPPSPASSRIRDRSWHTEARQRGSAVSPRARALPDVRTRTAGLGPLLRAADLPRSRLTHGEGAQTDQKAKPPQALIHTQGPKGLGVIAIIFPPYLLGARRAPLRTVEPWRGARQLLSPFPFPSLSPKPLSPYSPALLRPAPRPSDPTLAPRRSSPRHAAAQESTLPARSVRSEPRGLPPRRPGAPGFGDPGARTGQGLRPGGAGPSAARRGAYPRGRASRPRWRRACRASERTWRAAAGGCAAVKDVTNEPVGSGPGSYADASARPRWGSARGSRAQTRHSLCGPWRFRRGPRPCSRCPWGPARANPRDETATGWGRGRSSPALGDSPQTALERGGPQPARSGSCGGGGGGV